MLIDHCKQRLAQWARGDEAANHIAIRHFNFASEKPNVDIRHDTNLTPEGDYKRNYRRGVTHYVYNLPGWGSPGHFCKKVGYQKQESA